MHKNLTLISTTISSFLSFGAFILIIDRIWDKSTIRVVDGLVAGFIVANLVVNILSSIYQHLTMKSEYPQIEEEKSEE